MIWAFDSVGIHPYAPITISWPLLLVGIGLIAVHKPLSRWPVRHLTLNHLRNSPDPIILKTLEMADRCGKDLRTIVVQKSKDMIVADDIRIEGSKVELACEQLKELTTEELEFGLAYYFNYDASNTRRWLVISVFVFTGLCWLLNAALTMHHNVPLSRVALFIVFTTVLGGTVFLDRWIAARRWQAIQIDRFAQALAVTRNADAARSYVKKRILCLVANHDYCAWTPGKRIEQVPENLEKAIEIVNPS
jgi:hypothetical protein